jgi:hypothetical protein
MALTLRDILREMDQFQTSKGAPRKRELYSDLIVQSINAMGWAGTKSILYRSQIQSEATASDKTGAPKQYLTYVQFYDLQVKEKKTKATPTPIKIYNETYFFSIPTADCRVAMSCMCSDFTFTWEKELFDVGSLIGKWRPYQRKTTTWPQRNPKHVPGLCKHVWSLIKTLSSNDLVYWT